MSSLLRRFAPDSAERRPLGIGRWAKGQATVASTKALTLVLFGALGYAVIFSTLAMVRPTARPAAVKVPASTTGAEGVATLFVSTWLRTPPDQLEALKPFLPATIATHALPVDPNNPPPAIEVHQVVAVSAELVDRGEGTTPTPGYWSVLVAADVSNGAVRATRYFYVPVARASGHYVVLMTPAETSAPLGGVRIPIVEVGTSDTPKPTDPIAIATTRFLGAMLTGQGDVSTFSAPGANIAPVRPAPFTSIELLTLATHELAGAGKRVEVATSLSATDSVGHNWTLSYSLELAQRDGRWEVALLRTGPRLDPSQPDLTPAPLPTRVAPVVSSIPPTTTAVRPTTTTTAR